jgi:para-nitrobenzyl esterase
MKFGPAAPQTPTGGLTSSAPVRWAEDCLTLNICTPALDQKRRPVLVWIHGGAYRTGQGAVPWYNGTRLAQHGDIVVVSINYRLGALGFADLSRFGDEYATSGVNGILDQIQALQWVQANIANFGGDPEQVTIAGESAGGFSVSTLLGSPKAQGLFQQAIPQSGGAHHTLPKATAERVTDMFLSALEADGPIALDALAPEKILDAQAEVLKRLEDRSAAQTELADLQVPVDPFYPAVGNEVLPESPFTAIERGLGGDVAVLTGSNRHETTLWGYGDVSDEKLQRVAEMYDASEPLAAYRGQRPDAKPEDLMIALTTDHMFRIPAIRLLEAREQHTASNWMYWFCWESRAFGGRLGATHALEIPFAFDNLDRAGVDIFLGEGDKPQAVADAMHAAWINFIRDGDPGWEPYNSQSRATMQFDETSELVYDPDGAERESWEGHR